MKFRYLILSLAVFLSYIITAKLGLELSAVSGFATLVWAPAGIALGSMFLIGLRIWPVIFLAAFLVNLQTGATIPVATGIALGNTLEAIVAVVLLRKILSFQKSLDNLNSVLAFIIFGAVLSTLLAATIGTTSLWLGKVITLDSFFLTFLAWWVGDMIGDLLVATFILVWSKKVDFKLNSKRLLEVFLAFGLLIFACLVVFKGVLNVDTKTWPIIYYIFPPLIWIVLRFSQRETVSAVIILAVISIWGTIEGYGTFARPDLLESLYFLQGFLGVIGITLMILSAVLNERMQLGKKKDIFVGIVSHELKTPLTTIKGYLQLSLEQAKKQKETKLAKYLTHVNSQVDRLVGVVNDLVDTTRVTSGNMVLISEEFDINELVKEQIEDIKQTAKNHKIYFKPGMRKLIKADKFRISQVLINLLTNAIRYSPRANKIVVKTRVEGKNVVVSVQDFGIGIAPENQKLIFDRFAQIQSDKNQTSFAGLGLGLFITAEIIKNHSGRIWVDSQLGKGSIFSFSLPTKQS